MRPFLCHRGAQGSREGIKEKISWRRRGRCSYGVFTKTIMELERGGEIQGFLWGIQCFFSFFIPASNPQISDDLRGKEQTRSIFRRHMKNGFNPHFPQGATCKRSHRKIVLWFRVLRGIQLLCTPGKSAWSLGMLNAGFSTEASFSWMLRISPNWPSKKYLLMPLHPKLWQTCHPFGALLFIDRTVGESTSPEGKSLPKSSYPC